jgi:hypothetical protein
VGLAGCHFFASPTASPPGIPQHTSARTPVVLPERRVSCARRRVGRALGIGLEVRSGKYRWEAFANGDDLFLFGVADVKDLSEPVAQRSSVLRGCVECDLG